MALLWTLGGKAGGTKCAKKRAKLCAGKRAEQCARTRAFAYSNNSAYI